MVRYKIGEIAQLLGLTTQAIRFYEEQGLVRPDRSENGTRYYNEADVVLLLSLKKYRQSDFSVREIEEHFCDDDLSGLLGKLDRQRERLDEQASFFARKAEDMREYAAMVRRVREEAGTIRLYERPAGYVLDVPFDRLREASGAQLSDLTAYIDAMPGTGIAFRRAMRASGDAALYMCASADVVRRWNLPVRHAVLTPPRRVALCCGMIEPPTWSGEALAQCVARVRAAGFDVDMEDDIVGLHIASETVGGRVGIASRMYVPVV